MEGAEEAFGSCSLDKSGELKEEVTEFKGTRGVDTLRGWLHCFEGSKGGGVASGSPYGSSEIKPLVADGNELVGISWMDVSISLGARDERHNEVML